MDRTIEQSLAAWKESSIRHPLLLRGARQVGKSYIVEKFGTNAFPSFVKVNFESQPEAAACFESLDPEQILTRLQLIQSEKIVPGQTLLFLDEIQNCPQAIRALRYFKERLPALHIIGAGSLLEFTLLEENFSFPVGRIQFAYMGPLSFYEYVRARGRLDLLEGLAQCTVDLPISLQAHQELITLVKEYFLVGGMPASVENYRLSFSLNDVSQIQEILLSTYRADFSKYATPAEQRYLKLLFTGIFPLVGQQFKYSKVDPHMRSRELKRALDHLEWAGLIHPVYASSAGGIPLSFQSKPNQFKVIFLDIGLVQRALRVDPQTVLDQNLLQLHRGALAEQFVGQELLAYSSPHEEAQLFFWQREKLGSEAEVDYVMSVDGVIIPIEVKAGSSSKLKSLRQFMEEKNSPLGVRISEAPLTLKERVLSIPLYAICELPRLVRDTLHERQAQ